MDLFEGIFGHFSNFPTPKWRPLGLFLFFWGPNGRSYLWVLSLQFFVIDHGTITERGYLLVLSLQFFFNDHGTMTGRGYLWVLSLQIKNKKCITKELVPIENLLR